MIKEPSIEETMRIAKSLNITKRKGASGLHSTEDGEEKIALLEIKQGSKIIERRNRNDPSTAQNLRWVRNTQANKRILANYLLKRVVIYQLNHRRTLYYTTCCNTFSVKKPSEKQGHKKIISDYLLLLLGEKEKSKAITLRKGVRKQKKFKDQKELRKHLKPLLLSHFANEASLSHLNKFIEGLPQRDGCFQLPLVKKRRFSSCSGPCPLLKSEKPLKFKVDLVRDDVNLNQKETPCSSPSPSPQREKSIFTKSSQKNNSNKKAKTDFISAKKSFPVSNASSNDLPPPIFLESKSSRARDEIEDENAPKNEITSFERSTTPRPNLKLLLAKNQEQSKKNTFEEDPSFANTHLENLVNQFDNLSLANSSGQVMSKHNNQAVIFRTEGSLMSREADDDHGEESLLGKRRIDRDQEDQLSDDLIIDILFGKKERIRKMKKRVSQNTAENEDLKKMIETMMIQIERMRERGLCRTPRKMGSWKR